MLEAELSAGTIEYEDTGGDGPVLVLLHGLVQNGSLWRHVVADLGVGAHRDPGLVIRADLQLHDVGRLVGDERGRTDCPQQLLAVEHGPGRVGRRDDLLVVRELTVDQAADEVDPVEVEQDLVATAGQDDLDRLVDCCFGVTAPEPLRAVAEALVLEIGSEPVWVDQEMRPLYHAALAHGANHLVTLIAQSLQALAAAGVETPSRVLGPLVAAALDNSLRAGDAALTGPVARGDVETVARQRDAIAANAPELLALFDALCASTRDLAQSGGADR